ncbi:MAG: hypothetical protein HN348_29165, partial [Proteobacteria bacterium]|nr:hypothetical protein [Pseudomonadota bacterium]
GALATPNPSWFLLGTSKSDLRIPGTNLDLKAPERGLVVLQGRAADGSEILLGIEGQFARSRVIASTTDRARLSTLLKASAELMHQRSLVAFDPPHLRSRYQSPFISGSRR